MTGRESIQLLVLGASFIVAGYAAVRLLAGNPIGVGAWFIGSAVAHDLILFPLYAGLDATLVLLLHRRPGLATVAGVPWLNYLRVPTMISTLLLLVWSPLIVRAPTATYRAASGLSDQPFLPHWLAITGTLFTISVITLASRLTRPAESPPPSDSARRSQAR